MHSLINSEFHYYASRNIWNETLDESNLTNELKNSTHQTYQVCELRLTKRTIVALVLFTVIFCLAVVGNCMVIVTIVQNRWMRTVTNLFLLNLAISDLLLALICMPPTLIGRILFKCFLWGPLICKGIAYMQPVSVAACSFTLVAIAFERYNAICRPLHSRHWKTKKHALFMICTVWSLSFCCTMPSIVTSQLRQIEPGRYNCRQEWPYPSSSVVYLSFLTFCLLLIPLIVMTVLYSLVINTLWKGIQLDIQGTMTIDGEPTTYTDEIEVNMNNKYNSPKHCMIHHSSSSSEETKKILPHSQYSNLSSSSTNTLSVNTINVPRNHSLRRSPQSEHKILSDKTVLRSTHTEQNLSSKKRVIKMLAAIVAEFFICWTPLYTYHLYLLIWGGDENADLVLTFLILSYLSACTNPVTYCFMNGKFRNAFLIAFGCGCLVKSTYQNSKQSTYVPSSFIWAATKQFSEGKRRLSARRNAAHLGNVVQTNHYEQNCSIINGKKSLTVKLQQNSKVKNFNSHEITTTTSSATDNETVV